MHQLKNKTVTASNAVKVLLALENREMNDLYAISLIQEGVQPVRALNEDEILKILSKDPDIKLVFIDIDAPNYQGIDTVRKIKLSFNQVPIVVYTSKNDIGTVRALHKLNVFNIINKSFRFDDSVKTLLESLQTVLEGFAERRKFIRVRPPEYQYNKVTMQIPGIATRYTGKVKDISLGGIAITLDTDVLPALLFKGKDVELEIKLGFLDVVVQATVVARRGRDVAMFFRNLKPSVKKQISEYILSVLS